MEQIPLFAVHMPASVDKPLLQTVHSGFIGQGKRVEEFEQRLATFIGNENVLTLNSATSGLELALHLGGVTRDSEVISTPMTCMATNTPIISRGATPVWADVDPDTGLIDPYDVERKITPRTRAIMAVHWGGLPCDLEALNYIAGKYGLPLIEDAAHAFGATFGDKKIGDHTAWATAFSFQAIKHISTGDGGALFLADKNAYKRGKLLRWYGIDREGDRKDMRCEEDVFEAGWKFHMNDINATLGIVQMDYIEGILKAHRDNAKFLYEALAGVVTPAWDADFAFKNSTFWLFTILLQDEGERLQFMNWMKSQGIMTSQVHAAHHMHTTFRDFTRSPLPGVVDFSSRQVSIPVHWALTDEQKQHIVNAVFAFFRDGVNVVNA